LRGDLHQETYDEADYDQYQVECSIWDEGDQFFTESFSDWSRGLAARGVRPYDNTAGEVDYYRLELTLNELGRAFLVVDNFATDGERQFTA